MIVPLSEIYFDAKGRARKDYGDVKDLVKSFALHGQLQPVLIRDFDPEEWSDVDEDYSYVLVDGGRRFFAMSIAEKKEMEVPGLEPGHIHAIHRDELDPVDALILELETNEQRKDFDWRERAVHIRKIHEELAQSKEDWTQAKSAETMNISDTKLSRYLTLTSDEELWNHPEIANADSFRTAFKKHQILQDKKRRERLAKHQDKLEQLRDEGALADVSLSDVDEIAGKDEDSGESTESIDTVSCSDCRHWLAGIPDSHFSWIHWDPPYGGDQRGGAFTSHKRIDDDWMSASKLMREAIPEIFRVLQDGHWLAIWCHPNRTNWLARYLRGHDKSEEGEWCRYCSKPWKQSKLSEPCKKSPWSFWVNPYPCIWYKTNRDQDGHEIKRFLTNQYETFLLAAKCDEVSDPILPESNVGNVFAHRMVESDDRRHVMHKPHALLQDILNVISVPGSLGADPSAGSGSIIEAALRSGRKIRACEIDEDYADACRETIKKTILSMQKEAEDARLEKRGYK